MKLSKKVKGGLIEVRHFEVTKEDLEKERTILGAAGFSRSGYTENKLIEYLVFDRLNVKSISNRKNGFKYRSATVRFLYSWENKDSQEGYVCIFDPANAKWEDYKK